MMKTVTIGLIVVFVILCICNWFSSFQNKVFPLDSTSNEKLVYVIPVKGPIMDRGIAYFVKRAVKIAKANKADLIIIEIDTPGGAVTISKDEYTMGVVNAIEDASPIPTVAYVAKHALSAGVLISISCDKIVMQPDGVIGASEVIVVGGESQQHQEKYTSAFRAIYKAKAEKKGYPVNLIISMVDKDMEVLEVRVNGIRDFLTPSEIERAKNEGKTVQTIGQIVAPGKLLTLTAKDALNYGLAMAIAKKREDIPQIYGWTKATFREIFPTWSEHLVIFLTSPAVTAILIMIGMIAVWMAFKMPGSGVAEIIAITAFLLVFFGHYLVGLAEVTEILIFLGGLILLAVEIFLTPGFGVIGLCGIALIIISLILCMQGFTLPSRERPWEWQVLQRNFAIVAISIGLALPLFLLLVRLIPGTPYFKELILKTEERDTDGFTISLADSHALLGQQGIVFTDLRPSGKIQIGEKLVDVVSDGEYIKKGETVKVLRIEGQRIIVTKV